MDKFSQLISDAISENLSYIDLDDIKFVDNIIDLIDVDDIANRISSQLKNRILEFKATPKIDTNYSLSCSHCGRIRGVWTGSSGAEVNDHLVTANGKQIIIMDDF